MNLRIKEMDAEYRGQVRGEAIGQARGEAIGEARGQVKGEAIGEARGQARGEAIGEARGQTIGAKNNAIETAKRMLDRSFSIDDIVQISGLSASEVEALNSGSRE